MYTDFDEMDIEPKTELALTPQPQPQLQRNSSPPPEEECPAKSAKDDISEEDLQNQLLLKTVPLDDGSIGYVFTCTKNGSSVSWKCHVCNFVDSWKSFVKHMASAWHKDSMSKYQHPRASFTKIESAIPDISKGQPLPPGMEDEITGPCQLWKTLESYDHPLIGLEFLLEFQLLEMKEPRYLCLLCNKRGDPRSILVHLTSQSHYLIYLRKYFKSLYALIDKLPKSNECRGNVSIVTAHLIAKLEEKHGRLQPTPTRDDVINMPEQRTIMLQKIDSGVHFVESPEDKHLEDMLTVEYVQNTSLLLKNFPLKPKTIDKPKTEENSRSMFHKTRGGLTRKQLRNRNMSEPEHEEPDVVFISTMKPPPAPPRYEPRMREMSPRLRSRSYRSSRSPPDFRRRHMSPSYYYRSRHRSRSPRRRYSRSPHDRRRSRSPYRPSHYSSRHGHYRHTPDRYYRRTPSPDIRDIYGSRHRSHSRGRSPPPPSLHHHPRSRERSPHHHKPHKSRSPKPVAHVSKEVIKISDPPVKKAPAMNNNVKERPAENNTFGFQKELKEVQEKLDKEMEIYSETPENHPAYQDEWKKFWCNKFKELQTEGKIDPHTYDYKPEWINFWNVRVKELYNEELQKQRNELKTKYKLTEEQAVEGSSTKSKNADKVDEAKTPVIDIKTMWKELTGFEIKEAPATKQKIISPWEENDDDDNASAANRVTSTSKIDDKLIDSDAQPISPEPLSSISDTESRSRSRERSYSRSRSHSRSRSRSRSRRRSYSKDRELQLLLKEEYHRKPAKKIHFENPLNIITVLRQLSVLEFQLGSYANHIITLLSSGLAMERVKPQSSVDLLTKENVIFLELVKEKLKGQLLAGVVQKSMVKATLFCIKNIEELLLLVPKIKHVPPPPVPAPPPGLLYGAGVEGIPPAAPSIGYGHPPPPGPPPHPHMYHPYGMPPFGKPPILGPRTYDPRYRPERYPFRKIEPKKPDVPPVRTPYSSGKEEFPFADNAKNTKVGTPPVANEIPIDKILIAKQIAEVLTTQGRTDVTEQELQSLINTVVENVKRNDSARDPQAVARTVESLFPRQNTTQNIPPPIAVEQFQSSNDVVTIPAGFNLNDVPSSTLAILQDAYANVSSINASKTFSIEQLPESEIIQLLRNFKSIPRFKQEKLIEYLRKLEDSNPERVEELKKYVNVL